MKKTLEDYRTGAIGAMMDEYERAALELKTIVENIGESNYEQILDTETSDEDCRSIESIMNHVIHASYGYANGMRRKFSIAHEPLSKERRQIRHSEIGDEIDKVLAYTIETLGGKWEMSDDEIFNTVIEDRTNFRENLEQLLEHAIVHILRHRRQIDKFSLKFGEKN